MVYWFCFLPSIPIIMSKKISALFDVVPLHISRANIFKVTTSTFIYTVVELPSIAIVYIELVPLKKFTFFNGLILLPEFERIIDSSDCYLDILFGGDAVLFVVERMLLLKNKLSNYSNFINGLSTLLICDFHNGLSLKYSKNLTYGILSRLHRIVGFSVSNSSSTFKIRVSKSSINSTILILISGSPTTL